MGKRIDLMDHGRFLFCVVRAALATSQWRWPAAEEVHRYYSRYSAEARIDSIRRRLYRLWSLEYHGRTLQYCVDDEETGAKRLATRLVITTLRSARMGVLFMELAEQLRTPIARGAFVQLSMTRLGVEEEDARLFINYSLDAGYLETFRITDCGCEEADPENADELDRQFLTIGPRMRYEGEYLRLFVGKEELRLIRDEVSKEREISREIQETFGTLATIA